MKIIKGNAEKPTFLSELLTNREISLYRKGTEYTGFEENFILATGSTGIVDFNPDHIYMYAESAPEDARTAIAGVITDPVDMTNIDRIQLDFAGDSSSHQGDVYFRFLDPTDGSLVEEITVLSMYDVFYEPETFDRQIKSLDTSERFGPYKLELRVHINTHTEWLELNLYNMWLGDEGKLRATVEGTEGAGENLIDASKFVHGEMIRASNGGTAEAGNYCRTDYIVVEPNSTLSVNCQRTSSTAGLVFYDSEKRFIEGHTLTDLSENNFIVETPDNAVYLRFSIMKISISPDRAFLRYVRKDQPEQLSYRPSRAENHAKATADILAKQDYRGNSLLPDHMAFDSYTLKVDKEKYQIWEADESLSDYPYIYAAYENIIVRGSYTELWLYDLDNNKSYRLRRSNPSFPDWISDDAFEYAVILPWTRNHMVSNTHPARDWRLVIVTRRGNIYHNFPSRDTNSDGDYVEGDEGRFEQSVVWDMPERKHPSPDPVDGDVEMYYPGLPEVAYEYSPILNTDLGFEDPYGNGGFDRSITHDGTKYARFYDPRWKVFNHRHSFGVMNTFVPDDQLNLIGSYRDNGDDSGTRICIFATDDGGRSWYNKYEFASCNDKYRSVHNVNTSGLAEAYSGDSFVVKKRGLVIPTEQEKEPGDIFDLGADIIVSDITRSDPAVVTATAHGLETGDVVVFQDNELSSATSLDFDWMRNDAATNGSGGNGVMFEIKVTGDNAFELGEYMHSPFNNLFCRHIHGINRVKDGWLTVTGERYPYGWNLYTQHNRVETMMYVTAHGFAFESNTTRLNSTEGSAQRGMGALLLDDTDNTVIFATDDNVLSRPNLTLPTGRTDEVSRTPTGVYKGKLSDMDNFHEYECIFEAKQVCYAFGEFLNVWIFWGQRGEVGLSFDKGKTWFKERMRHPVFTGADNHGKGVSKNLVILGRYIIALK